MKTSPFFKTRITQMLGIDYPIICGGMNLISRAELVAAVSNAGGLGILVSAMYQDKEQLRQEIQKTRGLTDKPFGVNLNLFPRAPRPGVNIVTAGEFVEILAQEGVKIVETSGRSPEPIMPALKEAGIKVLHKTTAVRYAQTAQRVGADALIVVGYEAGGHPGMDDVASLVLIPQVVDALDIPVIVAGGVGDARGLVAALALGAEGVLMGTRFMATKESPAHPRLKEAMLAACEKDTVMIQRSLRNPVRVWANQQARKVLEMEERGAGLEELLTITGGDKNARVMLSGELEAGCVTFGQVVGQVRDIPLAGQVIEQMVREALDIRDRLCRE